MENISQNIIFLSSTQLLNGFKSNKLFKPDSIIFCPPPDENSGSAPGQRRIQKGMVQDACEVLKDVVFRGFVPDNVIYGFFINGFCEEGDFKRAVEFFNKAQASGFTPDIFMYNSLIKGLSKQSLVLQALEVLHEMPESGCKPDIGTISVRVGH